MTEQQPLFDLKPLDAVMRDHKRRENDAVYAAIVALRKAGIRIRPHPSKGRFAGYHIVDGKTRGNGHVLEMAKKLAGHVGRRRCMKAKPS